jgi:hypothetical protein
MCIKVGSNEMSSVKGLMTMSLNAIIADIFDVEPDELKRELRLREDLGMTDRQQVELAEMIAEYFDGVEVDLANSSSLGDIFEVVVDQEFKDIPEFAFLM